MDREEAAERKEDINKRINEIEQNRKNALNVPTEEEKKQENEVSDEDEGKARHNIKIKQKVVKYTRESETEVFYFHIFIIGRNQT